jgi:hypothetical protein
LKLGDRWYAIPAMKKRGVEATSLPWAYIDTGHGDLSIVRAARCPSSDELTSVGLNGRIQLKAGGLKVTTTVSTASPACRLLSKSCEQTREQFKQGRLDFFACSAARLAMPGTVAYGTIASRKRFS